MDTIYPIKRKISIPYQVTGFLFFGTLIFFCWRFYKERMLMMDGAFYGFRLIQGGFNAGPARYGDWVGELLPWLAWRMNLPLSVIIMLHSVSLMLFHYAIFLFITLKLKNNGAGLVVMLASCLAYAHAFYMPMQQCNEALVLGVLLWAFIHPETPYVGVKEKRWGTIGALLTIVVMSFFHPLSVFLILFLLGIEVTAFKRYADRQIWIVALVGIVWVFFKFKILFPTQYETNNIVPFSTILHELPGIKNWQSTVFMLSLVKFHFRSLIYLFIVCLLLTLRKGIMFFLFSVLFVGGFTLILLGTFYKGASALVYEGYFTIYGFFVGLIFVCLFYKPRWKNLTLLISLPFLWTGISRIYYSHSQFTYRLNYLSRIITDARENGIKKSFIDSKCYPGNYADAQWDVAFETLLYSSLPGPDSSVTIFIKDPSFDSIIRINRDKPNILFGVQFAPLWFTTNSLPQKYLHLPSTGYGYLTHPQADTSFHDTAFSAKNIEIIPLQQSICARKGDWVAVLPLKIVNASGKIIPAIPRDKNPVELSYRIYDKDGNGNAAYLPTPFETDVGKEEVSGLIIYPPFQKGTYFVKPDIVTAGSREWNLSCPLITVHVN